MPLIWMNQAALDQRYLMLSALDCVRVYMLTSPAIDNNTVTALEFDAERYDTNSLHSLVAESSRLTAARPGKYLLFANGNWNNHATGVRQIRIIINATTIVADSLVAPSGTTTSQSIATVWDMDAGDYAQMEVYQNSGGPLQLNAAEAYSPEFGMHFLSPS